MPYNIYFKKRTTLEERKACYAWFEQHMDSLPRQMELHGLTINDVPFTVRKMMHALHKKLESASLYEGQFALLRLIQETAMQKVEHTE